jgi:hypothetical protein
MAHPMTTFRIEAARKFLTKRYPDAATSVDLVDGTTEWVIQYRAPGGGVWKETIDTRQLRGLSPSEMLRAIDQRMESRIRADITRMDDTADAAAYTVGTLLKRNNDYEFRAASYMNPFRIDAADYGVGTFGYVSKVDPVAGTLTVSAQPRESTAQAMARIAAMSFAEYVAELHTALDPRGAGL